MGNSEGGRAAALRPTWLEIDLGALARNYRRVRDLVAPRRVWCVVKADAYGHGAVECSRRLAAEGADAFAVATVDEGIELRRAGIDGRVLVLAGVEPVEAVAAADAARAALEAGLEVAVWRPEAARALGEAALELQSAPARLHLKVDTGMGRLGVTVGDSADEALGVARQIAAIGGVRLEGLFSNLAAADSPSGPGARHTALQVERFARLCAALEEHDLLPPERHLSNSAAVVWHEPAWRPDWCNGVRPGLSLCGVPSVPGRDDEMQLEPVMSWHSAIAAVRSVEPGWPLGYGGVCRAPRAGTIAVVPVGYHDGFPRALSDRAEVLIEGRRAQVVGAISMDLTLVDITGISAAREGTPVVLLGPGGDAGDHAIGAHELAGWAGSIAHEVLCRVGARVPRRFVDSTR